MFNSPSCTKTAYQGICKTNVRSTHACQCSGFSFVTLSLFLICMNMLGEIMKGKDLVIAK